jgi:hypothetical protein
VTLEELKASNTEAVRISTEYGRSSTTPKDVLSVLSTNQYEVVKKGTVCEDTKVGIYIDGPQQGQKVKVCTNSKCSLHFSYNVQPGSSSPDMKEKRAKARKEAAVRSRVFTAIYTASASVSIEDQDYIAVAQHSISRADHNGLMKLAKLLDWPKDGGYKLQMQRNRFELIYNTPVAGAVGKWEARFAFHFSMARRGNESWTGALSDV